MKSFLLLLLSFSFIFGYVNPSSEQRRSITGDTLLANLSLARTIITWTLNFLIRYDFSSCVQNINLWRVSIWVTL